MSIKSREMIDKNLATIEEKIKNEGSYKLDYYNCGGFFIV